MASLTQVVVFSRDELDLIAAFAGCSLDEKPGSNWVQDGGGLPAYICQIARAIKKSGKSTSQAIAIAVSRIKLWAGGGGDVDADTRAKAGKALAQWEKLKSRSKDTVKASRPYSDVLVLANSKSFNVDIVRSAWDAKMREARKAWRTANPNGSYDDGPPYTYIKEQWTDYLVVRCGETGMASEPKLYKVPYTVDAKSGVTFSDPIEVQTAYIAVKPADLPGADITDSVLQAMMTASGPCPKVATDAVLLSIVPKRTALEQVLAVAARTR